jgi:GAF domain-containing protein
VVAGEQLFGMTSMDTTAGRDDQAGMPGDREDREGEELSEVADDAGLRRALSALSRLATDPDDLAMGLTRIAALASNAIPGADGVGLTLSRDGQVDMMVASTQFVAEVDAIQYGLGEGPCVSAAALGQTFHSAALDDDALWPSFGKAVAALGVHSALSLPLLTKSGVIGALNVYGRARDAFDDRAIALGELFAVPAAIAAQNARVFDDANRLSQQLQAALVHRSVIDQAIGILMSRTGSSEQGAFERLRVISQRENTKLHVIAKRLLDDAVASARARHVRASPSSTGSTPTDVGPAT